MTQLSPLRARTGRRSLLPTLLLTMLALLAVLATLLFTGNRNRNRGSGPDFGISIDAPLVSVTSGEAVKTTVTIRASGRFTGPVTLSAEDVPAGLTAVFTPASVTLGPHKPTASVTLTLQATGALAAGPLNVKVVAGASGQQQTTTVALQVQPDGSLASPPPSGTPTTSFSISGSPVAALAPGIRRAIAVRLDNPTDQTISVGTLRVELRGTSQAGCAIANFALTQYSGSYPLVLRPHSHNTLATLGIATQLWPQLSMLDLPVNQDACKGATVRLHFAGTGAGR